MNYWNNLNRSPEGEDGGESAEDASRLERLAGEGEEQEEEEDREPGDGGTSGEPQVGRAEPQPSLTKDDLTSILSTVIPASIERAQPQKEPQYTEADIEKMLNVWKADTAFLKRLGFENPTPEQIAAVHEMRDGLVRQSNTMMDARLQQYVKDQLKDIDELRGFVSEQRAMAYVQSFYTAHPELEKYEEIVDAVSSKMQQNGFKEADQTKLFNAIADGAKAVLKRMNIEVKAGTPARNGNNRMAKLSGGGSSGSTEAGPKRKPDMAIFDEPEE